MWKQTHYHNAAVTHLKSSYLSRFLVDRLFYFFTWLGSLHCFRYSHDLKVHEVHSVTCTVPELYGLHHAGTFSRTRAQRDTRFESSTSCHADTARVCSAATPTFSDITASVHVLLSGSIHEKHFNHEGNQPSSSCILLIFYLIFIFYVQLVTVTPSCRYIFLSSSIIFLTIT